MHHPILQDIVIIFSFSVFVLYICHKVRLPAIVGFLVTGVVIGPHGFGVVSSEKDVEILAEIGIVLLLFTIGIEFSLKKLVQIKRHVLLGGFLQVALTVGLTCLLTIYVLKGRVSEAVFLGFLIALSSTAIVLRVFDQQAAIDSPHGRTVLAILIFQDLIVVPMMIFTPVLAGGEAMDARSILLLIGKGVAVVVSAYLGARYIAPAVLQNIVRTRSRELFLLSVVTMGIAVAWLTSLAGLSLGLGAFLAGLVISDSEYSHEALEGMLPFRDVFLSFFFVSIGMLLDVGFLVQKPVVILLLAAAVPIAKSIIAGLVTLLLGGSLRKAVLVGFALGQVGEFSFILSKVGVSYGLIENENYQYFLAVSVITMAAAPFMMKLAPRLADIFAEMPFPDRLKISFRGKPEAARESAQLKDHLVIIGFGLNGRNLARAARTAEIPYRIIEMNPDTVQAERKKGEPIFFGDATYEAVLKRVHIEHARIAVIAISDPTATERITSLARRLNPSIYLIVRTRYILEVPVLLKLGANEVIPEEFETALKIFSLALTNYGLPRERIEQLIDDVRAEQYQMLRIPNK